MDKIYDPREIERHWYERWERDGYFEPAGNGSPFCIMIPPPNVTGSLHMGHAFQCTLMDALTRFSRMSGRRTLWQAGSDHAGIATQMVVERQLNAEGSTRQALGRAGFIDRVWRWKEESGGTIQRQLRRMGASLDWANERFTMDPDLSRAVREAFVRLYDDGLIYRGKRLVNWDPVLRTAVSDLEVISEEEEGRLWHIRYPYADGGGHLVVATTRPETMLGDTAVAVHPEDPRYRDVVGKEVLLPLCGRSIPVLADEQVDPEFGSGCLKITPAHDFNDYAVGQRHDLPMVNIFTDDARIGDQAPPAYRGLDRYAARERIVGDLESRGLLEKTESHRLVVPRGDRSNSAIEPYLTDQWFVRVESLAGPAIAAVEERRIRFVPENWEKTYFEWMRNLEDWCISRQIWWGHRIPAWYDADGNVFVGRDEAEVRTKHGLDDTAELRQDPDVLDTWFSSGLWPFSTLGWPDEPDGKGRLGTFYPTTVLITGFDIIFFWVARMIMMGLKLMGDVPFHEVYIHGLVRDADGNKMSKSRGNTLDPLDLIDGIELEELLVKRTAGLMQPDLAPRIRDATVRQFPDGIPSYGTDALRFTFCSLATTGRDIRFDLGRIEGYRNFCNKLWNAARFVFLNTEGEDCGQEGGCVELSLSDRWIISRLQEVEKETADAITSYRFDHAARAVYEFIWSEYCDWYLELAKVELAADGASPESLRGTRRTLVRVLEATLRLAHPMIPFITEEIWQRVRPLAAKEGETIMGQPYPAPDADRVDAGAMEEMGWVKGFILGVRQVRGEMGIPPGKRIPVLLRDGSDTDLARLERNRRNLAALARTESITWLGGDEAAPESATALLGQMKLLIPLQGLIDKESEIARLTKEVEKRKKEIGRSDGKLANPNFLERAPPAVVAKERARLAATRTAIGDLERQLRRLQAL